MKARTDSDVKANILLGVYHDTRLGLTQRFTDLRQANKAGRDFEKLGYQVVIRCGVSRLPEIYPYGSSE
jgi:hypothetical protein